MRMYPAGCRTVYSYGYLSLYTAAGALVQSSYYIYDGAVSNFLNFPSLAAGSYVAKVQMSAWDPNALNDFTFTVYAP
jgi:hypothetical protein